MFQLHGRMFPRSVGLLTSGLLLEMYYQVNMADI